MYKKFITGTLSNISLKTFTILLSFFITPLFVSKMGEEIYGIWILNFTIIGYFAIIINGLPGGIIKFISENKNNVNELSKITSISLATYFAIGIIIGSFVFLFSNSITDIFNVTEENKLLSVKLLKTASFFLAILWPLSISDSILQGLLKFKELNIIRAVQATTNSSAILLGLHFDISIEILLIISYSITCLSTLFMFYIVKTNIQGLTVSPRLFEKSLFTDLLKFSFGLVGIEISAILAYESNQLLIGYFLEVKYITIYFVTTAIFFNLRIIFGMLTALILPVVFESNKSNKNDLINLLILKGIRYINILFITVVIYSIIISKSFITLWMGKEYAQYGYWSSLVIIPYIFTSPYIAFTSRIILGLSKVKLVFYTNLIFTVIKILLNVLLINFFGIYGIFIGGVIVSLVSFLILFPYYCNVLNIKLKLILQENIFIHSFHFLLLTVGFILINIIELSWINFVVFSIIFFVFAFFVQYKYFFLIKEKVFVQNVVQHFLLFKKF